MVDIIYFFSLFHFHTYTLSLTYSLTYSLAYFLTHSLTQSINQSIKQTNKQTHTHTLSLSHLLTLSLSLTHSLTHSLSHSLAHSLTHFWGSEALRYAALSSVHRPCTRRRGSVSEGNGGGRMADQYEIGRKQNNDLDVACKGKKMVEGKRSSGWNET